VEVVVKIIRELVLRIMLYALLPTFLVAQVENWIYQYNGPAGNTEGADGNLYAAGASVGSGPGFSKDR
jgi:hypothetical protein